MTKEKIHIIQKILARSCWVLLGIGTIILLGAAMTNKSLMPCAKVEITITGVHNNIFIDEKDVSNILADLYGGELVGKPMQTIDLSLIAMSLQKNVWVRKAEVFFDNNQVLWVNISEREPIARILSNTGNSFYIDTSNLKIPLSEKFSARLPVFTGYNDSAATQNDTLLLKDINSISQYILNDTFWMAQIDQVVVTKERTFEMIPKIGNQVILFGTAERYQEKFHNLLLFYKNIMSKVGWNKYSTISVEYTGQVIGVKRGAEEVKMDSLKTVEIMKSILLKAQQQLSDTTGVQLTQNDEVIQQVVPLVNNDVPDENITLSNKTKINLAGDLSSTVVKKDSIIKTAVLKDTVKNKVINYKKVHNAPTKTIPKKTTVVKPNKK